MLLCFTNSTEEKGLSIITQSTKGYEVSPVDFFVHEVFGVILGSDTSCLLSNRTIKILPVTLRWSTKRVEKHEEILLLITMLSNILKSLSMIKSSCLKGYQLPEENRGPLLQLHQRKKYQKNN